MSRTKRSQRRYGGDKPYKAYPSEVLMHLNTDRFGNTKRDGWDVDWTNTRQIYRRYTNRLQRAAGKLKIYWGIEDHFDAMEDHGLIFDWRGYSEGSIELWREELAAEEEAFWESQSEDWDDPFDYPEEPDPIYYDYFDYDQFEY